MSEHETKANELEPSEQDDPKSEASAKAAASGAELTRLDWLILTAFGAILVIVAILLAKPGDEKTTASQSPTEPEVSLQGGLSGDRYEGTLFSFRVPDGAEEVSGQSDGNQQEVTFSFGSYGAGRIGAAPADPTQTPAVDVYGASVKRIGKLRIASASGDLYRSSTAGQRMLLAFGADRGQAYELQLSAPAGELKQAERLLRQIAASIKPTPEALGR